MQLHLVIILCCTLFCGGAVADVSQQNEQLSNGLRCLFENTMRELGDIHLGERDLHLDVPDEIILNITLTNMTLSEINKTIANNLRIEGVLIPTMYIDITIPQLTIRADEYDLWADIFLFEIVGAGNFLAYLRDVHFTMEMRLRVGVPPTVRDVETTFTVRDAEFHAENLMGEGEVSDMMNQILADLVVTLIDLQNARITEIINGIVINTANRILANTPLLELINTLQNACEQTTKLSLQ